MKIWINSSTNQPNLGRTVKKLGKSLKSELDGIYAIQFKPNTCRLKMRMYYQLTDNPDSFRELHLFIDIATYQDKLRINIIEDTANEQTLGQIILTEQQANNFNDVRKKVLNCIEKSISKKYGNFDYVY